SLLTALIQVSDILEEFRRFGEIALRGKRTGFDNGGGQTMRIDLQSLVGELFGFGLVSASESTLGRGDVGLYGIPRLPHRVIKISQANLNTKIIRFREKKLFQESDRFRLPVVFEVDFRKLQEERTGLAHNPLLDIEVGQLLEGANLFRGKFGDALIDGDGFG